MYDAFLSRAEGIGVRRPGAVIREAWHFDCPPVGEAVERQVHRAVAVVAGACRRVGAGIALVLPSRLPEDLRHSPGAVGVVDQETVALLPQGVVRPEERLGRGVLAETTPDQLSRS